MLRRACTDCARPGPCSSDRRERSVLLTGLDAAVERWVVTLDGLREAAVCARREEAGVPTATVDTVWVAGDRGPA